MITTRSHLATDKPTVIGTLVAIVHHKPGLIELVIDIQVVIGQRLITLVRPAGLVKVAAVQELLAFYQS